jgi:endo-1,4-beta-xylanase
MQVVNGADVVEVAKYDFESGNLTGWNVLNQGGGVSVSSEDKQNGSYSVKLTASTGSDYWSVQLETPQINTIPGHLYRISFWAKAVGGGGIIRLSTASASQLKAESGGEDRQYLPELNIGGEWTQYIYESVYGSRLQAGGYSLKLRIDAGKVPGKVYYIDDVLIEDLTPDLEELEGTTPMAKNHAKFLGNIIADQVPDNFNVYWNQVTSENAGKWESVERQRNVMTWAAHDRAYNHAKTNGFKFKYHTLVWGSQEPTWLGSLTQTQQKTELEEFMQAVANRYPDIDYIDVVNEALHAPSSIRQALGGDGVSGWDWVVWSFRKAREYFPNAKLHINDYGIISDPPKAQRYVEIVNILKQENLIDGIGIQCHEFNMNTVQVNTMRNVLSILAATGLPIHVSELDITGNTSISEENQFQVYRDKFPVLWEHESVIGITLWGYISGTTWRTGSGIVEQNGRERKAMVWLKSYMASEKSLVPNKFENYSNNIEPRFNDDIKIYPNPVDDYLTIKGKDIRGIKILDISGKNIRSVFESETFSVQDLNKGVYILKIEYDSYIEMRKFMKR